MNRRWLAFAVFAVLSLSAVLTLGAMASVSSHPISGTPQLASKNSIVRVLRQCGATMYAVGSFRAIDSHGHIYQRHNAFAFRASKPFTMRTWNPNVNGEVNSLACGPHGTVYLGGSFTRVHGTPVRNIAQISAQTGTVVGRFAHDANKPVQTLAITHGHLLAGGSFTAINGQARNLFASLGLSTGRPDGFAQLRLSGNYHYCDFRGCASDPPKIYNQQLSHSRRYDLVEGVFTRMQGKQRQQIAMLDVSGKQAKVTGWTSPDFFRHCASVESFYIRDAAWSPNDQSIVMGTTGYRYDKPNGSRGGPPMRYLCDAAASFPAAHESVAPNWINWTGCDSLYSAADDKTTAYFGGHERWSSNRYACDSPGRGHINAPGMEGLSNPHGKLVWNPGRARGAGADDMVLTGAGLWIASDNDSGGMCGGRQGFAGICFMPR